MHKEHTEQDDQLTVFDEQTLARFDRLDEENQLRIIELTRATANDRRVPRPEREMAAMRARELERRSKSAASRKDRRGF